jgi:hypothetical protein
MAYDIFYLAFVDGLVKAAISCLVRLLPTMGKHRVSPSTAIRYIMEQIEVCEIKIILSSNWITENTGFLLLFSNWNTNYC